MFFFPSTRIDSTTSEAKRRPTAIPAPAHGQAYRAPPAPHHPAHVLRTQADEARVLVRSTQEQASTLTIMVGYCY